MVVEQRELDQSKISLFNSHQLLQPHKASQAAGGLSYGVTDHRLFHEVKFSIKPLQATDDMSQARDCIAQLDSALSKAGLTKSMVAQQSTYSTSDPQQLQAVLSDYFKDETPTTNHIGEPTLEGNKVALEATALIPKGKNIRISRENVTLADGVSHQQVTIESENARVIKKAVHHSKYGLARYTVVEGADGSKRVYAAGLTGGPDDIEDSARGAFEMQKMILEAEGMKLADIMVQRNFIEDIDGDNYETFNTVRRQYYGDTFVQGDLHRDWPAATGIGADRNGITIKFMAEASDKRRVCIDNPGQTRSDSYTQQFQDEQAATDRAGRTLGQPMPKQGAGKTASRPAFSRALALIEAGSDEAAQGDVIGELFISGTASITGKVGGGKHIPYEREGYAPQNIDATEISKIVGREKLMESGLNVRETDDKVFIHADTAVEAQTIDTLNNISRLISEENLRSHGVDGYVDFKDLKRMRYYVKDPKEYHLVKNICEKIMGDAPGIYVKADVCYAGLLFEADGAVTVRKGTNQEIERKAEGKEASKSKPMQLDSHYFDNMMFATETQCKAETEARALAYGEKESDITQANILKAQHTGADLDPERLVFAKVDPQVSHGVKGTVVNTPVGKVVIARADSQDDVIGTQYLEECDAIGGKFQRKGSQYLFLYHSSSATRNKDFKSFMKWAIEQSDGEETVEAALCCRRGLDDETFTQEPTLGQVFQELKSENPHARLHHMRRPVGPNTYYGALTVSQHGAVQTNCPLHNDPPLTGLWDQGEKEEIAFDKV